MNIDIQYQPAFSMGTIQLAPGEEVRVEGGAMIAMSAGVTMETKATGGFLKSLARSVLGGESFFQNTYLAGPAGGHVLVAPVLPGDLFVHEMTGAPLLVQSGSYVASQTSIEVSTKWGGAKTFFAGEGLIMLNVSGAGTLLLSSYGAIHEVDLGPGETYTIDTGHLVAFDAAMGFNVRAIGGIKSTLFSGEGLVVDLTGPGKVLLQTRNTTGLVGWLTEKLPFQKSGSNS